MGSRRVGNNLGSWVGFWHRDPLGEWHSQGGAGRGDVDGGERENAGGGDHQLGSFFAALKVTLCALAADPCRDRNACRFWPDHGTSHSPWLSPTPSQKASALSRLFSLHCAQCAARSPPSAPSSAA